MLRVHRNQRGELVIGFYSENCLRIIGVHFTMPIWYYLFVYIYIYIYLWCTYICICIAPEILVWNVEPHISGLNRTNSTRGKTFREVPLSCTSNFACGEALLRSRACTKVTQTFGSSQNHIAVLCINHQQPPAVTNRAQSKPPPITFRDWCRVVWREAWSAHLLQDGAAL